ncbi:MAG: M67 family metallopeptidase [Acidipila sp.]|nr:M67 family metallopeptidase [Acidipila sp.]
MGTGMGLGVKIRAGALLLLREEARTALPQECCGFLAGSGGVITVVLPACNFLASPTSFEIAPQELFRLVREIRAQKLEHLGIYHSHPAGGNFPSPRDIQRAFYPQLAYFILSPLRDAANPVRAFSIRESRVTELTIETVQG